MLERRKKLYEGKAKILYKTNKEGLLIQEFKDDATAFDATKRGRIKDKGICNNRISAKLFAVLANKGLPTHFLKQLGEREMLVKRVRIIPLEVTIRNIVAGGMAKLLGLEEGTRLNSPVLEFHYKNDVLHDPLINEYHIRALKLATDNEMKQIIKKSFIINTILTRFFDKRGLILVDFKLEFGRFRRRVLLADEISPDTCRLWDKKTQEKLDKDRFRRDLGEVESAYQEVLRRVTQ